MGGGIAMALVNAGIPVILKETDQAALDRGMAAVRKNYDSSVKKGRLTAQEMEAADRVDPSSTDIRRLRRCRYHR